VTRVLFLCVHNAARSQMAEGLLRHLGAGRFEAFSAGVEATSVRPLAVAAMREIGVDISGHRSKRVDEYLDQEFDVVVTVCADYESCPIPPRAKRVRHWPFEDPSRGEGIEAYRNVRDGLRRLIEIELIDEGAAAGSGAAS
jgi:arsenate reductase